MASALMILGCLVCVVGCVSFAPRTTDDAMILYAINKIYRIDGFIWRCNTRTVFSELILIRTGRSITSRMQFAFCGTRHRRRIVLTRRLDCFFPACVYTDMSGVSGGISRSSFRFRCPCAPFLSYMRSTQHGFLTRKIGSFFECYTAQNLEKP